MHKSQLVSLLIEEAKISHAQAESVVDIFFNCIEEGMIKGERTEIRGLGSFKIKDYKSYVGRNPKTGAAIEVESKKMPFFKVGRELKAMVSNEKKPVKKVPTK